ncbi:leucyl/phenylalanyl-tRNA--protein transferase [Inhella inkyongensis]|uniref:leucyl/phenylalanyl-tRNA--protein transferase n=1 Tax=Inhella inkyongensis TaxID=392593 RepID=UPI00110F2046|nr:leucyl/phenylalanyl-tRNA--protein transferase [Inhella inkyongensis]
MVRLHPNSLAFPDPREALGPESEAPGLLAVGGDLRAERLIEAYRHGVFPWYGPGQPILWWCLQPRMVLKTADFKLHPSLRKTLKKTLRSPDHELRVNHDPAAVIRACAETARAGQAGTWILPEMQDAYIELARRGVVQSFETWHQGQLVGGLYGLRLGRMFFGESMFARQKDASKLALCHLIALCRRDSIPWIDCQQNTRHLASLGAAEVGLTEFLQHLRQTVDTEAPPPWTYDSQAWTHLLGP